MKHIWSDSDDEHIEVSGVSTDLQLADASHCAAQQNQEYACRQRCLEFTAGNALCCLHSQVTSCEGSAFPSDRLLFYQNHSIDISARESAALRESCSACAAGMSAIL